MIWFSDLHLLPYYFLILLWLLLIYINSMLFHELGHLLYFKYKLNKEVSVYFVYESILNFYWKVGQAYNYYDLSKEQYSGVMFAGVLMGLIPIIISIVFNTSPFPIILMVVPYSVSCLHDLKNINIENDI